MSFSWAAWYLAKAVLIVAIEVFDRLARGKGPGEPTAEWYPECSPDLSSSLLRSCREFAISLNARAPKGKRERISRNSLVSEGLAALVQLKASPHHHFVLLRGNLQRLRLPADRFGEVRGLGVGRRKRAQKARVLPA